MRCCSLTHYGRRELALTTCAAGVLSVLMWLVFWPLVVVPVGLWLWVLWFFRDPRRTPPTEANLFVSPADGRITDITPVGPDSFLNRDGTRVGVFMDIFSVHVNRSPCSGTVAEIVHRDGAFLDARDPTAGERNESTTVTLTVRANGQEHPVVFRQIAGLVARRIVTDLKKGQPVTCGQRVGMIKFGSRAELLVPSELVGQVKVSIGQRVRAGESVLLTCRQQMTTRE